MKRIGPGLEQIAEPDNLRLAFWKASRGRRGQREVAAFAEGLDRHILELHRELIAGTVTVGCCHYFTIRDPKERLVCAASFRERVLHHAIMNVCEPVFERAAIFDSYACRRGKGREAAIDRARGYAARHQWFLKLDIRKFFDSVDHAVVMDRLSRQFKDYRVLELFGRILTSYSTATGKGVPIGNLTSQHFANDYLAPLDRFIKETLRCPAYVRYMDDFVLWSNDRAYLRRAWNEIEVFLATRLRLSLKCGASLNRTCRGMDFLGARIFPRLVRLSRSSRRRFARKLLRYENNWIEGRWTEAQLQRRVEPLLAFARSADSAAFRRAVLRRSRVAATGLESRDTRRQLEQRRQQLRVFLPQQQRPVEPQQQHRFPGCPGPSSIPLAQTSGTDPAAIPSWVGASRLAPPTQAKAPSPPGASSPAGGGIESSGRTLSNLRTAAPTDSQEARS